LLRKALIVVKLQIHTQNRRKTFHRRFAESAVISRITAGGYSFRNLLTGGIIR